VEITPAGAVVGVLTNSDTLHLSSAAVKEPEPSGRMLRTHPTHHGRRQKILETFF
jgi:hypothetical protein